MTSVFEKTPNLPGFISEFKDGGLQARTETVAPGTESVLLLGTAVDGPIMEPVAVDPNTVELVFGRETQANGLPNGSTLVKAFREAYAGGARDIRLMRITGAQAKAVLKAKSVARSTETPVADVLGVAAGNVETTFTLNKVNIDPTSVVLNADGKDISSTHITVLEDGVSNATVTLEAGVVNQDAAVYITYTDDLGNTVTENGFVNADGSITFYVATGVLTSFPVSTTVKTGTLKVYANGVEVPSEAVAYNAGTQAVDLQPGFVAMGELLEANFIHEEVVTEAPELKLESVFGGSVYNQLKAELVTVFAADGVTAVGKKVVITKPESKRAQLAEAPLEYSTVDFPSFANLVNAINSDPRNGGTVRASVAKRHELASPQDLESASVFSGGNDGLAPTKQDLFDILGGKRDANGELATAGAYHLLENYTVDTIIPLGVFADDVLAGRYDNFAYQLALACAVISHRNSTTSGVIATSSPDEAGLAAVRDHFNKLLAHKNDYFMRDRVGNVLKDSDGKNIDLGRFIQVVAGPDVIMSNPRLGTYADNTVGGYQGFVAQLAAQSAPTNKVLPFALGLRYTFSNSQLDALTAARYVTFKLKNNGNNVAVTDAPTAAQPESDYRRLTTLRVVKEVVNSLRDVCDPYIGEPNETAQQNAMSAAISKRLDILKEAGVIIGHEFNIVVTQEMQLMGEAVIELTIVPPQELRKITTIVSLRPSL